MELLEQLQTHRLVAIVRGGDRDQCVRVVVRLAELGIRLVEMSLVSDDAWTAIGRAADVCRHDHPGTAVGVGTVRTAVDAQRAVDVGAGFAVTPALGGGLTECARIGLPVIGGGLTPTECLQAHEAGASAVKLFPASLGGPEYLRALRAPLPHIPFVPVGGVDAHAAAAYLSAGAVAVGVGSPLVADAADGGSLEQLDARVAEFLQIARPIEGPT